MQVVENKEEKNVDTVSLHCYNSCMSKAQPTKIRGLVYRGVDAQMVGAAEPTWPSAEEQINWTPNQRIRALGDAFRWYNLTQDNKRVDEFVAEWLDRMPKRKQLAQIIRKQGNMPSTFGWLCRAATVGYCLQMKDLRHIQKALSNSVQASLQEQSQKVQEAPKPTVKKPTIQDRINEKMSECKGEIAGAMDDFIKAGYEGQPNMAKLLIQYNVPQARVKEVAAMLERDYRELLQVQAGNDKELAEGYQQMGKRQVNRLIDWLKTAQEQIWSYGTMKAANRKPKVRKGQTPQKMVSKLKYLAKDTELKLESIDPVDILKASELWVYDVKKRKLGIYVADDTQSALYVKGGKILGYSETRSVCKTMRKPEQQIKELMAAGKPASKKWFGELKAVESKLNGRITENMLLLKAYK